MAAAIEGAAEAEDFLLSMLSIQKAEQAAILHIANCRTAATQGRQTICSKRQHLQSEASSA